MKRLTFLVLFLTASAHGQVFSVLPEHPPIAGAWSVPGPRPLRGVIVEVDTAALEAQLSKAPKQRFDAQLSEYGLAISLPSPTGALIECAVAESPVMEPALAARFPLIQTFIVQSLDRSAAGRLEVSPRGVTAMLRTNDGGAWMIDPWQSGDSAHAVAYWLRDLPGGGDWVCHTSDGGPDVEEYAAASDAGGEGEGGLRGGLNLRTIRFAVACTGNYGLYHSQIQGHAPNVADPLAAIVTVVARTNVVFEADLAVHFNLVANNDQVVFFDPATDPYPSGCDGSGGADCSGAILGPNITLLNSVIGTANYELGHVLTRVAGGVAYLSCLCTDNRAGGVSGIPRGGGDIDPFSALVVIHEIGHQLGGNHTFSGTRGRCAGNVRLASAWEAGSGSSPLAYAGGCPVGDAAPSDNIVLFADPFFHHGSVREMLLLLANRTCPVQTPSGNTAPVIVSASGDFAIPPGTPFTLAAEATDADGDLLTYSWEQFDNGVARPLTGPDAIDNGAGSLFRIFPPVASPQRTFPRIADVLSGLPTPGEKLPTVTGVTRQFRVIVRDNHPGAGAAVISEFVNLSIPSGTSSFGVVAPVQGATLDAGPTVVEWTVGGTGAPPISCASVTIRLSTDDGATFNQLLGTFPNNGAALATLPQVPASSVTARIRIDADGEIFFAVSPPFVLLGGCAADFDGNGVREVSDIFAFLNAWFAHDPAADVDGTPGIGVPDIYVFLSLWFAGCP